MTNGYHPWQLDNNTLRKEKQEQDLEARKRREIEQQGHLAYQDAVKAQIADIKKACLTQEGSQIYKKKKNDLASPIASSTEKLPLGDAGPYQ